MKQNAKQRPQKKGPTVQLSEKMSTNKNATARSTSGAEYSVKKNNENKQQRDPKSTKKQKLLWLNNFHILHMRIFLLDHGHTR